MMRKEKTIVREFYDNFGWSRNASGIYKDTASFVDLRPVLSPYYRRTQRRVSKFLKPSGEYFLDAGSGPASQPAHLLYSARYHYRVCVDLSIQALREAQSRPDVQLLCVLGDVVHLPFPDNVFDAILASHVLYHVPEDEQANALHELYRTMKPGGTCVIIYIWPTSRMAQLSEWIRRVAHSIASLFPRSSPAARDAGCDDRSHERSAAPVPPLYFHPHDYDWVRRTLPEHWDTDIRVWRSVDGTFSRNLVPDNFVGTALLWVIYWLEEMFPHALARLGSYPMILIRKAAG